MLSRKISLVIALGCCLQGLVFGQYGLNTAHLQSNPISQRYQPANILECGEAKFRYFGTASIWGANNSFDLAGILAENGTITDAAAQEMVDGIGNSFRANFGMDVDPAFVNAQIKGRMWSFGVDQQIKFGAGSKASGTLGLILLGNKSYQGETIEDQGLNFIRMKYRSLSVGTGFDLGKIKLGVRGKLIQGSRFIQLRNSQYSLYTETDGTRIDVDADYDLLRTKEFNGISLAKTQGFGLGADVGMLMDLNDKMTLSAALTDVGFIAWPNVKRYNNNVSLSYEGISVSSLFADNLDSTVQQSVDSLIDLMLPDSSELTYTMLLPMSIRVGLRYNLSEKDVLIPELIYSPMNNGAKTALPLLNVAYQRELHSMITVGANLYGGGTDLYGVGLMADAHFPSGPVQVHIHLATDNIIALIAPGAGRGFGLFGGIGLSLLGSGGGS